MRPRNDRIDLSASDLGRFLSCRHLTALDLAVAKKLRPKPPIYPDPALEILKERGLEHEKAFIERERSGGKKKIVDLTDQDDRAAKTIAAMKQGADIIYQGELAHDGWFGYADVLRRVEKPGRHLGDWSYEVIDTKLSRETKGTTILQLALYSEVVGEIQGDDPEYLYVVTPDGEERYRLNDFDAYYRLVKRGLAAAITGDALELAAENYPEPVEYCDVCRWEQECTRRRRNDDHLSLVANISRLQRRELESRGVATLAKLAGMPIPISPPPARGTAATYERVREQARVQLAGREKNAPVHELILPIKDGEGLARLPAPSRGDIFLDLEGDPFVGDGGREYLFGVVTLGARRKPEYRAFWALTAEEERAAFEQVIDLMIAALDTDPKMHVYHFGGYEPGAMKRLMGRYATREAEVDRLLRGEHFVDLLTVVRQGVRASVESYSIKKLEPFYGFAREMDLKKSGDIRAVVERCLETNRRDKITDDDRTIVAAYNKDDCVSTLRLRDWLETLRGELVAAGTDVPRPQPSDAEPSEELSEDLERIRRLMDALLDGLPVSERAPVEQARWILAHLLGYHRREDKVSWWEKFRLAELPLDEYADEPRALSGLVFVQTVKEGKRGANTDRYVYPPQDNDIHGGDELRDENGKFGVVADQDRAARTIDIRKLKDRAEEHPPALFAFKHVSSKALVAALERVAVAVIENACENAGSFRAAWSLLANEPPRLREGEFKKRRGESALDFATRVVTRLDGTALPIQGPPGSGKTFTGGRMICELLRAGKRVGVTGPSHAVVDNLLHKVIEEAQAAGLDVLCGHKDDDDGVDDGILRFENGGKALAALDAGEIQVLGGTAWLWAAESAKGTVDVLVCDEAGQMSLANMIAASGAADSVVLLGDPQQLEQVQQGSHPDGVGVSALQHVVGDQHQTIPEDRGIFLDETWRMHPSICAFISEAFYEGRLHSCAGLEQQALYGTRRFDGAGLWLVPVEHDGNRNDSPEEVTAIEGIVRELLGRKSGWINATGDKERLKPEHILVVSPYNRQVGELAQRLMPHGVRVGTVDKFQGQQAAVVIYSMAASSASESSRGMEFLYNLNRLNVATSRARCATIVVASPLLLEPECRSPRQMRLANGLCRFAEMARVVTAL